jgi:hypothetical protein
VVESSGLLNRRRGKPLPGVRIPPSPPVPKFPYTYTETNGCGATASGRLRPGRGVDSRGTQEVSADRWSGVFPRSAQGDQERRRACHGRPQSMRRNGRSSLGPSLAARSPRLEDQVDIHHVITCALPRDGVVLAKITKVDCAGESLEELVRVSIVVRSAGLCPP